MDPHELAIAALSQVAHSAESRDPATGEGPVAAHSSPSNPVTGNDLPEPNNAIVDGSNDLQGVGGQPERGGDISYEEGVQQSQNGGGVGLESTSSNNSQATNVDIHDGITTPLTSDELSSQSTNQDGQLSQLSQLSQLAAAQQPLASTTRPNLTIVPSAGVKRTADGQVKGPAFSPISPQRRGHSRNTSAVSNVSAASSKIGELSSELRTRLSYAMIKVNNGWQSHSIDEVESLASQKGSPTSSSSTVHGRRSMLTSPRATIASIQNQSSNLSAISQATSGDFDLYSRTEPASRTYESFWADHSSASVPTNRRSPNLASPPLPKSLAPSADIRPVPSSRRSGTPKFVKPPAVPTHGSGTSYHNTSAPRTPTRPDYRDGQSMQTPTQKTVQEQDAIETLIFMSSPGNSGSLLHAFPPPRTVGSPHQSPLRAEFNIQRESQSRRVEFEEPLTSTSTGSSEGADYRSKIGGVKLSKVRGQTDAIDRMLDEMSDSSSDEDEPALKYASPRRVAAAGLSS